MKDDNFITFFKLINKAEISKAPVQLCVKATNFEEIFFYDFLTFFEKTIS